MMTKAQDQKDEAAAEKVRLDNEYAAEQARAEQERNKPVAAKQLDAKLATDTAARLRAFEDEVFGKRAVRINGVIERGVGSPYAAMTEERKAQYAALEALVAAEQKLNDAAALAAQAEADRVVAEENLAQTEKAAAEADKVAKEEAAKEKADAAP